MRPRKPKQDGTRTGDHALIGWFNRSFVTFIFGVFALSLLGLMP